MINLLICVILNVLITFGMTIALVEKGNTWPIKKPRIILQKILHDYISWRFSLVLFCSTCCSFWLSLVSDIVLFMLNLLFFHSFYFFWPFSGFITLGITWFLIELLNAIGPSSSK